ncbi:MAG: helix-turn-helix transcriptional regulator [Oscillospiraceae bacterium]|nr:helix-turn-helix transcriptional regulator [Oscillospiraceae bacterium]
MKVGEKIRKFRTEKGLSQKELAKMAGLSEPAIRNYELGNRTPSDKQIDAIAGALDISPFAISNPDIESYIGVMHTLFALEEEYGATLVCEPGATYITFPAGSDLRSRLSDWGEVFSKLKDGSMTKEEYEEWKNTYPKSLIYNKK